MRRPFATFEQVVGNGVVGDRGQLAQPNHSEPLPARRPFSTLVQVSDSSADPYCTHRFYNETGRQLWRADHGSRVNAVTIAADGSVYTAGEATDSHNTPEKCYRLIKWSARGGKKWGIKANGQIGYDVSVDSAGNVWLAAGEYLEKYSSGGVLLNQFSKFDDPWVSAFDGTWRTAYFTSIQRVVVTPSDRVWFGCAETNTPAFFSAFQAGPFASLGGNSFDLAGDNHAVFYAYNFLPDPELRFDESQVIKHSRYDYDLSGNMYKSHVINAPYYVAPIGFVDHVKVSDATPTIDYFYRFGPPPLHKEVGYSETSLANVANPSGIGSSAVAVHRPSGEVLVTFGVGGIGTIKHHSNLLPHDGLPYLESRPNIVEEATAGYKGVLRCNDAFRYVYGINDPGSTPGCTHRIRDYPSTFVWEGNHRGTVYDARITNTGRVLVGGDRVYDP